MNIYTCDHIPKRQVFHLDMLIRYCICKSYEIYIEVYERDFNQKTLAPSRVANHVVLALA